MVMLTFIVLSIPLVATKQSKGWHCTQFTTVEENEILQWIRNNRMIVQSLQRRSDWRGEILPAPSPRSIFINLPVRFSQINHLPSSLPLATYSPTNQSEDVILIVLLLKLHADWIPQAMRNSFSVTKIGTRLTNKRLTPPQWNWIKRIKENQASWNYRTLHP